MTSPAMRRWQVALVSVGVLGLLIALGQLLALIPPARYAGLAAWLIGALILHDGVLAFATLGAAVLLRRRAKGIPFAVILIAQGAVIVAAIITILVLPEVIKKVLGSANPSILPLNYLANLGLLYAGLAAVTAAVIGAYLAVRSARARSARTS